MSVLIPVTLFQRLSPVGKHHVDRVKAEDMRAQDEGFGDDDAHVSLMSAASTSVK